MKRKFILSALVILLSLLMLFGCSVSIYKNPKVTNSTSVEMTVAQTLEDATASASSEKEYTPDYRDENELEILTIPAADTQESTESQKSTEPITKPDFNDYIESDTKIELPFVPID